MDAYSESVKIESVHIINEGKPPTMYAFAVPVNLLKFSALSQQTFFG